MPDGVLKAGRSLSTVCFAFSLNSYIVVCVLIETNLKETAWFR